MAPMQASKVVAIAIAFTAATMPGQALASGPALSTSAPSNAPIKSETRTGVIELSGKAYAYLPKGMDGKPRPLLVSLYGAGGQASVVLDAYREFADREGFILMIPTSTSGTWDMIEDLKIADRHRNERNAAIRQGPESHRYGVGRPVHQGRS